MAELAFAKMKFSYRFYGGAAAIFFSFIMDGLGAWLKFKWTPVVFPYFKWEIEKTGALFWVGLLLIAWELSAAVWERFSSKG